MVPLDVHSVLRDLYVFVEGLNVVFGVFGLEAEGFKLVLSGVNLLADISVFQGDDAGFILLLPDSTLSLLNLNIQNPSLILEQLHLRGVRGTFGHKLFHTGLDLVVLEAARLSLAQSLVNIVCQHMHNITLFMKLLLLPIQVQQPFLSRLLYTNQVSLELGLLSHQMAPNPI